MSSYSSDNFFSFQEIIFILEQYWHKQGCSIIPAYDLEMGAGTFHPATVLYALSEKKWNIAYIQPSRRPSDSRYGQHPNRAERYYQFQVILKPSPDNMQELYLKSLKELKIDISKNDLLFSEDDWESPTLGASGLGWEILLNGAEISQFTYMQQIGAISIKPVIGEITYGLERIAMYLQKKKSISDIIWNKNDKNAITYGQIHKMYEEQFSEFNIELADTTMLEDFFKQTEKTILLLIEKNLPLPAYEQCTKASHTFNLLESRNVLGVTQRAVYIKKIRDLVKLSCNKWLELNNA